MSAECRCGQPVFAGTVHGVVLRWPDGLCPSCSLTGGSAPIPTEATDANAPSCARCGKPGHDAPNCGATLVIPNA